MSENICRRGERMSSGVSGSFDVTSRDGMEAFSGASTKMASKSVRNIEKTGAGILSVGEKTMPTLRMLILLTSELLMTVIKKLDSARRSVKLGLGSLFTKML